VGAAELVAKPLLYPGESAALREANAAVRTAQNQLWTDTQELPSAIAGLGENDPSVIQLERRIGAERQTVHALQAQAERLPNHDQAAGAAGFGVGVGLGLLACGVKLGIQKIRTDKSRR